MPNPLRVIKVEDASRNKLIVPSAFSGYDVCMNPYVGCAFGCKFCYVRFFIKDKDKDWGDFVRLRKHIIDKLPNEINNFKKKRLVIGTMTDPYQPIEKSQKLTLTAIETILKNPGAFKKVGILTRSPLILRDLHIIAKLPKARINISISPFEDNIIKLLEPIAISIKHRLEVVRRIKKAGIRVHVNIAPALPLLSENITSYIVDQLFDIGVDEFFVDPMQAYNESFTATTNALKHLPIWKDVEKIVKDKDAFNAWKEIYENDFIIQVQDLRNKSPNTLAIWSDHISGRKWIDAGTGKNMDWHKYGDDIKKK